MENNQISDAGRAALTKVHRGGSWVIGFLDNEDDDNDEHSGDSDDDDDN